MDSRLGETTASEVLRPLALPFLQTNGPGENGVAPAASGASWTCESRIVGPRAHRLPSNLLGPKAHRLPFWVMWCIVLLTAMGVAVLNFVIVLSVQWLARLKFAAMQSVVATGLVHRGIIVLIVFSVGYSTFMVCLIEFLAPICGGSGIPENKTYLNGGSMPGFFTRRTLGIRAVTNVLANAAGFPVGREGPMVTMGSNIAFMISNWLARPYVKEPFDSTGEGPRALLVDDQRLAHATRIACTVGGACAMAAIFNAPFGGLLYMFEEVTSVAWPLELTFRVFVTTMCCSLVSYSLCYLISSDISQFVIYAPNTQTKDWQWQDMPIFILLSLMSGVLTSLHTRGLLAFTRLRQAIKGRLRKNQPYAIIIETAVYCAVCSLASSLVSLLSECAEQGEAGLEYVQFNCPEGEYNPIASLLLTTSHSAVKLLYSGNGAGESAYPCILAFITYGSLNTGLGGLPVPGGAFTATMLMGGLFGRSVGVVCRDVGLTGSASNGIYAVVGSAAMLCGFKQMTLASVLIVVECVNDLSLAPVVMLAVTISMAVNWTMNEHGYDEDVILSKKLPFLEGEAPVCLDGSVALDLCDPLPAFAVLSPEASVEEVERALKEKQINYFPVREGESGACLGIVRRPPLQHLFEAASDRKAAAPTFGRTASLPPTPKKRLSSSVPDLVSLENGAHQHLAPMQSVNIVPLHRVMDPTPFVVVEDMPAPRLYALFAKAGERAACVISIRGELRGIISREGLIAVVRNQRLRRH